MLNNSSHMHKSLLSALAAVLMLASCSQVEQQQALLEQARADYRVRTHTEATQSARQKFTEWQNALATASYAEFYRTDETKGDVVPMVKPVKISGEQFQLLLVILRQAQPTPLPDADVLTTPGSEPLALNNDGEVVPTWELPPPILPDSFWALDFLRFYDANGNEVAFEIQAFHDMVPASVAQEKRNTWTNSNRPFIVLPDAEWQRYRELPAYRTFVSRLKKAHSTGKWDVTPDFSAL